MILTKNITDCVDTADLEHSDFGDRLEVRPAEHCVDPLVEPGLDAHLDGNLPGEASPLAIVAIVQGEKSAAETEMK